MQACAQEVLLSSMARKTWCLRDAWVAERHCMAHRRDVHMPHGVHTAIRHGGRKSSKHVEEVLHGACEVRSL